MKFKGYILIVLLIFLILSLTSCSTEYNNSINEYEKLFDKVMNLLDPENVRESIVNNNITSDLEQLENLVMKIEESVPINKEDELLIIKQKHAILKEIIDKGLRWSSLDGMDKLSIKDRIKILK